MAEYMRKFIIIKSKDVDEYLSTEQANELNDILQTISRGRAAKGKRENTYYVCNEEEPYAAKV